METREEPSYSLRVHPFPGGGGGSRFALRALDELWVAVLEMAAMVESALHKATNAFVDRRLDLADEVERKEPEIDRLEVRIEEACLKVLALHQPVASDLRRVTTVFKVNGLLERMADLALNIAKRVKKLQGVALPADLSGELEALARDALTQVRDSLDALAGRNAANGRAVRERFPELNRRRRSLTRKIKREIIAAPDRIDDWLLLINTARNFSRVAEHASGIAENAVYLCEGKIIRHAT